MKRGRGGTSKLDRGEYRVNDMLCHLDTNNCDIVCVKNGETWSISRQDDLPDALKQEYDDCREWQRVKFHQAFREDPSVSDDEGFSEYEPEDESSSEDSESEEGEDEGESAGAQESEESEERENQGEEKEKEPTSWFTGQSSDREIQRAQYQQEFFVPSHPSREKGCRESKTTVDRIEKDKHMPPLFALREALQKLTKIDDVKFVVVLGQGQNGMVFTICNPAISSQMLVVKYMFSNNPESLRNEEKMQNKFHAVGLGPPVIAYDDEHILIMAKVDGTIGSLLHRKMPEEVLDRIVFWIVDLIRRLCDAGLLHRDFHWNNLGYRINMETREISLILIDFGNAKEQECEPDFEIATLIAFLYDHGRQARFEPTNVAYLHERLLNLYEANFGAVNPQDRKNIEYWKSIYHAKYEKPKKPDVISPEAYVYNFGVENALIMCDNAICPLFQQTPTPAIVVFWLEQLIWFRDSVVIPDGGAHATGNAWNAKISAITIQDVGDTDIFLVLAHHDKTKMGFHANVLTEMFNAEAVRRLRQLFAKAADEDDLDLVIITCTLDHFNAYYHGQDDFPRANSEIILPRATLKNMNLGFLDVKGADYQLIYRLRMQIE